MNKFFLGLVVLLLVFSTESYAQNLPVFKNNLQSQSILTKSIDELGELEKGNPSPNLERKLEIYQLTLNILTEQREIPFDISVAVTTAFLNTAVKWNNITDGEALNRFLSKQWGPEFIDLINLLKL